MGPGMIAVLPLGLFVRLPLEYSVGAHLYFQTVGNWRCEYVLPSGLGPR